MFIIPSLSIYQLTLILYICQGISHALFDICMNGAVLNLWNGISNSPINGVQAGYGIGALIAVFISKPFVKYSKNNNRTTNSTNLISALRNETIVPSLPNITLQVPYTVAGFIGILISVAFVIAQYYESKNVKRQNRKSQVSIKIEEIEKLNDNKLESTLEKPEKSNYISNLIFNDKIYDAKVFKSKLLLTTLLIFLAMSIGGFSIILANFMLTYTTKGPAKLSLNSFFLIQMLFWVFNVVGRLLASVVAYKLNTLVYFFVLIILNFTCISLYSIPQLNSTTIFYWLIIIPLSTVNGPIIPSTMMVLKHVMGQVSSVLIAIFGIGLAIGAVSVQYLTSFLLDEFEPNPNWLSYKDATSVYIIPIIILINVSVSFIVLIVLIIVFNSLNKKYGEKS